MPGGALKHLVNDPGKPGLVSGFDPVEHLSYLVQMLDGFCEDQAKLTALRRLMDRGGPQADASLFWHGSAGTSLPIVPSSLAHVFEAIPAPLHCDFDTD